MSELPSHHDDQYPAHSGFEILFEDYFYRTRGSFDKRMAKAIEYAEFRNGPRAAEWKALTDEAFSIKLTDHLPGDHCTPEMMEERKSRLKDQLLQYGFARDEKGALKLYKDLGRHAHVALENLIDSPDEALAKRPYHLEIDKHGTQRMRGARGRFRSAKSRMDLDLADQLGDMKRAWVDRLKDPSHEERMRTIFNGHLEAWTNLCFPFKEIQAAAEEGDFTAAEIMAVAEDKFAVPHKLKPLHDWPAHSKADPADVAAYIDEMQLKEPLVKMLVLQRIEAELRPLVWELGEEYYAKGEHENHIDVLEVEDRILEQLEESRDHLLGFASEHIAEDEFELLEDDVEALIDAATTSVADFMPKQQSDRAR